MVLTLFKYKNISLYIITSGDEYSNTLYSCKHDYSSTDIMHNLVVTDTVDLFRQPTLLGYVFMIVP